MVAFADEIAQRVGRGAEDPSVRNTAGALIGVSLAALLGAAADPAANYLELLDASLAHLEAGLPL